MKVLLGSHTRLRTLEIIKAMHDYRVVRVELEEPRLSLVVKIAGPQAELACPFERTAHLLRLVSRRTSVPVAQVIAADERYRSWPGRYLVTERLPGQQWFHLRPKLSMAELDFGYTQIGEALAQLHAIQFTGFGELSSSLNPVAPGDFVTAWQTRAHDFIPDERLRAVFLSALQPRHDWFTPLDQARLCHEDLHGYNLLFAPGSAGWRLSGVLDFDKAWAGCRESDLARLEFWDGMTGPAFWQAYQANFPIEPAYSQRRLLYQLFWCLEYAQPTSRHQADTDKVCEALGIPGVKFK